MAWLLDNYRRVYELRQKLERTPEEQQEMERIIEFERKHQEEVDQLFRKRMASLKPGETYKFFSTE